MKKETVIAILLGVTFGVVVAVVVTMKTGKRVSQKVTPISNNLQVTPTVAVKNTEVHSLEITEPTEGTTTNANSITIKGKASKESLIVIQSPLKNVVFKNEKEDFSTEFPLALGENVILVTMYPSDKQTSQQEKALRVYYLDEQ